MALPQDKLTKFLNTAKQERIVERPELIKAIQNRLSQEFEYYVSELQMHLILSLVFDEIGLNLTNGKDVSISNFGRFRTNAAKAKVRHSYITDEDVYVPAHRQPRFRAAQPLKDMINHRRHGGLYTYDHYKKAAVLMREKLEDF